MNTILAVLVVFIVQGTEFNIVPIKAYDKQIDCLSEAREMQKKYPISNFDCVIIRRI